MASVFPVDTPLFKVLYFVMVLFQFIVPAFPVIGFYTGAFPTLYFFLNEPIKPYVLKMCYTFVHQIIFPGSCILSVRTLRKKNKFQLLGISYKFVTIYFLYYRVETLPNDSNCTCIGFQPFGKKKCTCTYWLFGNPNFVQTQRAQTHMYVDKWLVPLTQLIQTPHVADEEWSFYNNHHASNRLHYIQHTPLHLPASWQLQHLWVGKVY